MNNPSPSSSPSFFKLLTSALLSYTLLMTPLASVAAANVRSGVPARSAATAKAAAESPARPAPAPAPEEGGASAARGAQPASALAPSALLAPLVGAVTATMTAVVSPNDGDGGKIDPTNGVPATTEKITYTASLSNSSASDATGLTFSVPLDTHTSLVPGSLNSTPVAFDVSVTTNEDTGVTVTLAGQDPDGSNLTFTNIGSPSHGSLGAWGPVTCSPSTGVCTSSATYTPAANYFGSDGFTFRVNDGTAASNEAGTVSITVNGVNDVPTFTAGVDQTINEDAGAQSVSNFITNVRPAQPGNTTEDTQTVSFEITNNTNPTLFSSAPALNVAGATYPKTATLTYTPALNQNGEATITYRAKDNGGTANGGVDTSATSTFKITVNAVNDKPTVVAPTGIVVQANMKRIGLGGLLANVSDVDNGVNGCVATPFKVKSGSISVTTPAGGTFTNVDLNAGTFDFDPPPGFTGGNVTFTYVVTDNGCPGTADSDPVTVSIAVQGPVIWFVNPALASDGDGRLSNPFKFLQSAVVKLNSLAANQRIFVYTGTTEVMAIPAGQQGTPNTVTLSGSGTQAAAHWLIGQGAIGSDFDTLMGLTGGLAVPSNTIARPSINGTRPTVRSTISMKDNTVLRGADVNVTAAAAGSKGVTNGAIGGTSTIEISDVDVTSAGGNAVDFSSGQTVNFTGSNNDITSGTGIALNVVNTTIGASNFNFKSITAGTAASGPSSGIVLNNTGAVGRLIVVGGGSAAQGGDASGGTIQKTSGAGISLTSTRNPSFNNIKILNTTGSGIDGTGVTTFTLTNSNLTGNGSSGVTDSSNIAFNDVATANVAGTITITNNILNTGFYHGVDIFNTGGTIDDAVISNNLIVSDTNGTLSLGSGIRLIGFGNAAVASVITKATLNANNIQNFPSGAGITIQGGNSNSTSAPPTTMGVSGHATNKINVTNNLIKGQSAANRIGVYGIQASVNGRGQGNFNISNNGTAANPITNVAGNVISHSALGFANVTTTIANNVIVANHTVGVGGALGISVGVGRTFAVTDSASLSVSITGNNVSQTDANGILARAVEGQSVMNISVKNNTVAAPLSGVRPGIRVDSGTSEAGTNANVCLDISGNTSAGSGGTQGLGMRKQGTSTSVNIYGVKGMSATATPNVEAFVNGQNPAGNGTLLISATSGFSNCSTSPDAPLGPSADVAPRTQKQQSLSSGRSVEEMRALVDADEVQAPDRTPEMQMQSQAPAGSASLLKFNAPFIAPLLAPAATTPEAGRAAVEATHAPAEATRTEAAQAATAPARVWSDMPAGSESAAVNVADVRDDDSAQYGARIVGASYERRASERADAPVGDAVATAVAAAPAPESTTEEVSRAAAVYAAMARSLLAVAFFSGETVTVSGKNNAGFTLPVGRTVTITFQATLNNPPNFASYSATQTVSAQGTLSGAFTGNPLLTDDTSVGGANDPTVTPVDLFNTTSAITGASPSSTTNTGQAVTFTATITPNNTPAPAGGTLPGGTATFKDGGVDIAGCVLVTVTSGQAQCTTSALSTGTHNNITVDYKGDGNFDPSSSAAFAQTVSKSNTTTSVTSSTAPNPSLVNQSVTYTATVASATAVTGPPTGTVVFKDGGTTISGCGSVSLSSGTAQCTTTPSTSGNHIITAFYNGDDSQGRFNASDNTASPFTQVVNASGTNLVVSSSLNPSLVSQAVTFTATINSTTAVTGPPTGTVQFWDGPSGTGTALGSPVALTTGGACAAGKSCASTSAISNLTAGTHTITADYSGDTAFSANSSTLPGGQVVNKSGTATALTTSGSPTLPGAEVTFTATVTSTTAVAGPPTGTVTFYDGASAITCSNAGGQTLNGSGVATCKTSSLSVAVHDITAQYNGDDSQNRFNASTSPIVQQTVGNPCSATSVVLNTNDSGAGSLREAILNACDAGTVTFDSTAFAAPGPYTITLASASGPLDIDKNLTIQGPGSGVLTVSGNDQIRVFTVASGKTVNINGLTVTKGKAPDGAAGAPGENGGAILNSGTLTLTGVVVSNSNAGVGGAGGASAGGAGGYGGGIFNDATPGTLFLVNSTVSGNNSGVGGTGSPAGFGGGGGGIFNLGNLTVNGSTIGGNHALGQDAEGGGLDSEGGTATLINSTISGNTATGAGGGFLNCGTSNAVLTNVTVTNNRSDSDGDSSGDGGGIGQISSGTLTLNNTIVAGNFKGNAVGVKQSETITVAGTANVNGNIIVRVTAAGMTGSPKNVTVAVANGDSASAVATKIRTALTGNTDVNAFFDVSTGTNPEDVVLTVKTAAANDATMHVKIFGNATGIQDKDSTHTATGVAPVSAQQQIETLQLTGTVGSCTAGAGTITLTVTANGMNNSPVAVQVNVADGDDASAVAGKIRTFLGGGGAPDITNFFTVGGTGADVSFTKQTADADDGTLVVTAGGDSPCTGIGSTSANTQAGVASSAGTQQQETVTVSGGPVDNDGTIQVTVTAAGMTGSPKTIPVTVSAGESNNVVAGLIASALNGDTDISGFFTATSAAADVILTAKTADDDDSSMKVSIIGNATGIDNADSAPTTAGVFQEASDIDASGPSPGAVSGSFNLIGTGGTGGLTNTNNNQINVDPTTVFAAGLASNGGPTQTVALNTTGPAIDTGSGALTALTTLSAGINAVVTTVAVSVADSIPAGYNYTIRVENEQMVVTAKSGNNLTVTRGANGTTAATHASGASVYAAVDQRGFQRPVDSSATTGAGDESDIGAYEAQTKPNAPNAPDLDAASDTGASNTDNVTGDSSPTFTIGGVISGATVKLYRDDDGAGGNPAAVVATGTAAGSSIQLTDPSAPTSATPYVYSATQTLGGAPESDQSATLSVTVDTSAPGAPGTPDLQAASDTGLSSTDNITNATSRVFDVSSTDSGATVKLLRDTVPSTGVTVVASTAGNGGTVQLTDSTAAADGTYAYSSLQTNGVGVNSPTSGSLNVVIDTTAPSAPTAIDLQAASDSGNNTDNITNAASRAFDITGTTSGVRVELYRGATFVAFTTGNGATVTITDSASVSDGPYNYTARQVDTAGNFAATSPLAVVLDTVSAPATPDLQAGSDSGSSSTDNITKTTPRAFDIASTENGATVELLRGGSAIASTTGTGGTVTLSDTNGALADNTYAYATRQTDVAGNVGTSAALNVVLDTTVTPNTPDLDAASDTGASNTDNRTSAATPHVFNVTIAEAGSTVELLRGGTPVANTTGTGSVQLNDTNALADGTYQYSTRETDVAGNVATSSNLAVTIDTTAPSVSSSTRADADPTSAASVNFTVTFNESVTGVDAADFATSTSGSITGTSVTGVSGSGTTYTVTVSTGTGDGTIRLDVVNDGSIKDAMNLALGAGFTTGQVYIVDRSSPTVSSITRAGASPTGAASVNFTVTFSEPVSGVDTADFSAVATGSVAGASVSGVLPASGPSKTYTVAVSTGSGTPGTVGLNLVDNDSIVDGVSKPLGGAGAGNGNFTGEVYNIDKTAPNTSVVYAGVDNPAHGPTSSAIVNFTVTFTKPVTGFDSSDITLGGTAGATVANVSETAPNNGTTYNVAVEGMTTSGTITVAVGAGVATDDAGNGNNASGTASVNFVPDNFSAFVVNTTADTDDGSCAPVGTGNGCTLREAIAAADADFGAETITFDATVFAAPGPYTINLGSALPDITSDVTITGPGANVLKVRRNAGTLRIFYVHSGATAFISGLTASEGNAPGGGGIRVGNGSGDNGTLTLTRVVVTNNNGSTGGGGIAVLGGSTLTVVESTVSTNQALSGFGGGISNDGTLSLVNSTVSGNSAGSGGGIYANGTTTLANSTVAGNNAATSVGGGIYQVAGTVTLKSTIVGDNTAATANTEDLNGTFSSDGFNLIEKVGTATVNQNGGAGPNITGQDPVLRPLADNGATTQTHSLQCTSPAIDKGKAFGAATDQRGLSRVFDLADAVFPNAAGGDGSDIGALETQSGGGCLPAAIAPTPSTNEDTQSGTITLTGTYSQNTPLSFSITQTPGHGTLTALSSPSCTYDSGNALNTCTATLKYTPSLNFNGLDTFKFKVSTGSLDSESADVNVTVNPVNDVPVATPQSVATDEDVALGITLSGTDVEGSTLTFTVVASPLHGTLSGTAPDLTYTPATNYNGPDSFTFRTNDGALNSTDSTIAIVVNPVNDAPVAVNDTYDASENTPLSVTAANGVVKNDTDVENQTLTAILFASPTHAASFALNANGSFSYTPVANFIGNDTFTYRADDSSSLNNLSNLATVTIKVNAGGLLQFSAATFSAPENDGTATITVTRTGGSSGAASVNYATATGGTATGAAACAAGVDYVTTSGTLNWADGDTASKTFAVTLCDDTLFELDKTVNLALTGAGGSGELGSLTAATLTITDADAPGGVFGFGQATYTVGERGGFATVTVTRTGDTTRAANVDYTTDDGADTHVPVPCSATTGSALERCDYTASFGTLRFAAGDTSKTFVVLITDDSYVEGTETTALKLSNPTNGGALALGGGAAASLQIQDDVPESATNRNDDDASFVTEHYHDFLGRHPDAAGLQFWTQGITSCGADQGCRKVKRINTSAAFFLSIEFQNTGFYAYRVHKAAMGDEQGTFTDGQGTHQVQVPAIRLRQFLRDSRAVGEGVVVGQGNWQAQIETNKRALALEVVQRPGFLARYPTQTSATAFVASLDSNTGGVLTDAQRSNLIQQLSANPADPALRAEVLRTVAETEPFQLAEKNRAFVLMQYYGYLRRNPNDAPEAGLDYSGYVYWLSKLNQFNGNFIDAEMVKAFIESIEYRQRFGQ